MPYRAAPAIPQEAISAAIAAAIAHRQDVLVDGDIAADEKTALVAFAVALRGQGVNALDCLLDACRRGPATPGFLPYTP